MRDILELCAKVVIYIKECGIQVGVQALQQNALNVKIVKYKL